MKQPETLRELITATLGREISNLTTDDIQKGLDMKLRINTNFVDVLTEEEMQITCSEESTHGEVIAWLEDTKN